MASEGLDERARRARPREEVWDGEDARRSCRSVDRSVCEARRSAAPLLAHRKDLEALWPNPALPRTAENAKRLATLGLLIGSAVPDQCQLP